MNLTFQFEDITQFLAMEGHGPYVWACYTLVLLGILGLALAPVIAKKGFIASYRRMLRREEADFAQQDNQ